MREVVSVKTLHLGKNSSKKKRKELLSSHALPVIKYVADLPKFFNIEDAENLGHIFERLNCCFHRQDTVQFKYKGFCSEQAVHQVQFSHLAGSDVLSSPSRIFRPLSW